MMKRLCHSSTDGNSFLNVLHIPTSRLASCEMVMVTDRILEEAMESSGKFAISLVSAIGAIASESIV